MGDKAYFSTENRSYLRKRGIKASSPSRTTRRRTAAGAAARAAHPPVRDPARYNERNTVERCFAKLKQFRGVATL